MHPAGSPPPPESADRAARAERLLRHVAIALWALFVLVPLQHTQHLRASILGQELVVTQSLVAIVTLVALAAAVVVARARRRRLSRLELAWGLVALSPLPGALLADDAFWSLRQWLVLVVKCTGPAAILVLTTHTADEVRRALRVLLGVAALAAAITVTDALTGWNPYHGLYAVERVPFGEGNVLFRARGPVWSSTQAGTQGNRIPATTMLVPFVPLAAIWVVRDARRRSAFLAAALLVCAACAVTAARSGWLGVLVAFVAWLVLARRAHRAETLVFAALVTFAIALTALVPDLRAQVEEAAGRTDSILERVITWPAAWALLDAPFCGLGYGRFPVAFGKYVGPYKETACADNQYLRWAVECGIPSFVLLLSAAVATILGAIRRARSVTGARRPELLALTAGWIGIASTFVFFDGFYWAGSGATFWCTLALLIRHAAASPEHASDETARPPGAGASLDQATGPASGSAA